MLLSACRQPGSKALGKVRCKNSVLRAFQIVGHAVEGHDSALRVKHGKSCTPVAVARLTDRTRIHQETHFLLERKFESFSSSQGLVLGAKRIQVRAVGHETSL